MEVVFEILIGEKQFDIKVGFEDDATTLQVMYALKAAQTEISTMWDKYTDTNKDKFKKIPTIADLLTLK